MNAEQRIWSKNIDTAQVLLTFCLGFDTKRKQKLFSHFWWKRRIRLVSVQGFLLDRSEIRNLQAKDLG